jgi:hypothetical protein
MPWVVVLRLTALTHAGALEKINTAKNAIK